MGSQLLAQWTTSYFLPYQDCHLFQQQFVFNIEINGSVKLFQKIGTIIRTSHDPKWQACMRETDADRSWQAGHRKPWTSIRFFQTWCTRRIQRKAFPIGYAHSSERDIPEGEGDASKVATQRWKHSIHTHFRKYRKRSIPRTEETGDLTTVERKSESRNNNQQLAAVVQDLTTQWILPVWNQNFSGDGEEFYEGFQPSQKPKVIKTDDLLKFGKSCEELSWNHRTTTLCRSETIEIAERAVRRVKEGTSAVLMQSGLTEKWW